MYIVYIRVRAVLCALHLSAEEADGGGDRLVSRLCLSWSLCWWIHCQYQPVPHQVCVCGDLLDHLHYSFIHNSILLRWPLLLSNTLSLSLSLLLFLSLFLSLSHPPSLSFSLYLCLSLPPSLSCSLSFSLFLSLSLPPSLSCSLSFSLHPSLAPSLSLSLPPYLTPSLSPPLAGTTLSACSSTLGRSWQTTWRCAWLVHCRTTTRSMDTCQKGS